MHVQKTIIFFEFQEISVDLSEVVDIKYNLDLKAMNITFFKADSSRIDIPLGGPIGPSNAEEQNLEVVEIRESEGNLDTLYGYDIVYVPFQFACWSSNYYKKIIPKTLKGENFLKTYVDAVESTIKKIKKLHESAIRDGNMLIVKI